MGNPQPRAELYMVHEELEDPKVAQQAPAEEVMEPGALDSGQARLQGLGYKQELQRKFGLFASFSSSLALMAYSSGLTGARARARCRSILAGACMGLQPGACLTPHQQHGVHACAAGMLSQPCAAAGSMHVLWSSCIVMRLSFAGP